jgi:hypothetical protein
MIEMIENFYIRNQLIKTNRLIYLMTKSHKKMKKSKISLYLENFFLIFDAKIQTKDGTKPITYSLFRF